MSRKSGLLEFILNTSGVGQDDVGSKSWILIGGRTFQPSEYLKLFLIVYFAGVFYNKSKNRESIQNLTMNDISKPVFIWLVMLLLVGLETDLGAVIILFCIAFGLLISSGMTGKVLVKFGVSIFAMGAFLLGVLLLVKRDSIFTESRIGRFTSFRNPFEYSEGSGHQIINGYYAIGNGGLDGILP